MLIFFYYYLIALMHFCPSRSPCRDSVNSSFISISCGNFYTITLVCIYSSRFILPTTNFLENSLQLLNTLWTPTSGLAGIFFLYAHVIILFFYIGVLGLCCLFAGQRCKYSIYFLENFFFSPNFGSKFCF